MQNFEIIEYSEQWAHAAESLFVSYVIDDLKMELTDEVIREKIWQNVFIGGCKQGVLSIALAVLNGEAIGVAIYQIDTPKSDWCKREGWGFIRELFISPKHRRKGCGTLLAEYAERKLREQTDRLYLTADDAVEFWSSCGYAVTDTQNENGTYTMIK